MNYLYAIYLFPHKPLHTDLYTQTHTHTNIRTHTYTHTHARTHVNINPFEALASSKYSYVARHYTLLGKIACNWL